MDQKEAGLVADDEAKPDLASVKKQWATLIPKKETQTIVWTQLSTNKTQDEQCSPPSPERIHVPLIVGTVDTLHYRMRYEETLQHIENWIEKQQACNCALHKDAGSCSSIQPELCYLLNLEEHPSVGVKKIVFEGWRQKLLPKLFSLSTTTIDFVLVAEDDIRIPDHMTPCHLVQLCKDAFSSHPHLDLLSLGHSWKALQKQTKIRPQDVENRNLLRYLQSAKGAGVHGATLFAIQCPQGIERLQEALEQAAHEKKQTHLDQFLFFSTLHTLNIALIDPPVVGWAEVEVTLTKSSSGYRRRGGGRLGFLPSVESTRNESEQKDDDGVIWIERHVVPVVENQEEA